MRGATAAVAAKHLDSQPVKCGTEVLMVKVLSHSGVPQRPISYQCALNLIDSGIARVENERRGRIRTIRSVATLEATRALAVSTWRDIEEELRLFGASGLGGIDHRRISSSPSAR
jgi:hypothetical protein